MSNEVLELKILNYTQIVISIDYKHWINMFKEIPFYFMVLFVVL